ncbi:TAXI family TRAP transporter solute-binding subunit [Piscinibacter sp.]|uniref:TAXI family TRAP transporter solute-binding subunit n=1 Tax=Piscinibacter sp. TaxID=1903157 RepID=UPI002BB3075F|nr:TAXI family TRAP transporter solute-binding subunit [Albitalea sp.]HUG25105.1 TAXI family TRAP transporter solute-binding subunit [Albitalea sp.]
MKAWFVIAVFLGLALGPPALAQNEVVMLTGNTGGVYYPLGIALARIWERAIPDTRVNVQSTRASVENFNLLQQRRGTFAFGQGDVMSDAFKGNVEAGFPNSRNRLRMMAALFPNYLHLVALKSAKVGAVQDLKGKRVSVGAPRSGNELNARVLLGAAGMSYADLRRVDYLAYNDAVALMRDGQLDAIIVSAGLGVKAVTELAAAVPVDIVPIGAELIARSAGVFAPETIPAGTYAGQAQDVHTAALINFLVTQSDVPDTLVYAAMKALYGNLAELRASHVAARDIALERALVSRPIALHPGAERFFREAGLLR